MAIEIQYPDGSYGGLRERDGLPLWRAGGYAGAAGSNVPSYSGGATAMFLISGGTDTAGGLLGWTNNLGYDIIVVGHVLEVTTQSSGACTVSFGQTPTSNVTSSSNMINGQTVAAAGVFNGGALSVKVKQNEFITGSKATGASAGLVGKAYFTFVPVTSGAAVG